MTDPDGLDPVYYRQIGEGGSESTVTHKGLIEMSLVALLTYE